MFCADYFASFAIHALSTAGLLTLLQGTQSRGILILSAEMGCGMGLIQTPMPFLWGGISGFLATCAVFPFDFVRVALAPPGTSKTTLFRGSLSTVPYSAVFFGVYFCGRQTSDRFFPSRHPFFAMNIPKPLIFPDFIKGVLVLPLHLRAP